MHELSLATALLDMVEDYAKRERIDRVRSLKLSWGKYSGIDPEAFKFLFSVQAEGTRAEGVELVFDIRPAVFYCLTCEKEFTSRTFQATCSCCGGKDILLTGGTEELQLVEMEVD